MKILSMNETETPVIPIVPARELSNAGGVEELMSLMDVFYGEQTEYFRARKALEEVTEYAQAMHHLNICPMMLSTPLNELQNDADYELSDSVATILYCVQRRADKAGMKFVDALNLLVRMAHDKITGRMKDPDYLRK